MLQSALDHYRAEQRITAAGLVAARRRRFGTLPELLRTVVSFQLLAAQEAVRAVEPMLDEQNIDAPPEATTRVAPLLGQASDGRPLAGLLEFTRSRFATSAQFDRIVATQLQDVARQAAAIEMATRPKVTTYTRMLNPPSCARCAILAGREYRKNAGFQRHPRCDCRAIPTVEVAAGDLVTDPRVYFDSLSPADQGRIFTQAGAEAIRRGADIGKVVNARRGMSRAQSGRLERRDFRGRQIYTTTEGSAGKGRVRLMPESILEMAEDEADALRLLRVHGYIT